MYQHGDIFARIDGEDIPLRLTMGGLAEVSIKLSARGPLALANVLRKPTPGQGRIMLEAMLGAHRSSAASLNPEDIAALMPKISAVFETSFGGEHV